MTDQVPEPDQAPEHDPTVDETGIVEAAGTGVPAVDGVLADLDTLDERPLDEHLAAFERAHDTLRSALDAGPGEPA
jgi:hypothetical protein